MAYDFEKEKREAMEAGNRALHSLREAQTNLDSARNWGLWDMFGGGTITSLIKSSRMDRAKQNMEQAKYDLRSFSKELNDVSMVINLDIETGDFLSFADWFFDNFFVDWMVQDRINKARDQVRDAIWKVENVMRELERYQYQTDKELVRIGIPHYLGNANGLYMCTIEYI